MKKIAVIGFGISGKSAALFLLKQGCQVTAVDKKAEEIKQSLADPLFLPQNFQLVSDEIDLPLQEVSQVILSPGVSQNHPLVQKAIREKIEVIGEIELAFRHIKNRCIGITGSNGKTTTVLLVAHILNASGRKAKAVGNVGFSLCNYLMDPDPEEILVVELSSYQLETLEAKSLEAAGILNITPNHLDRYPSLQAYAEAKCRIQKCLKERGALFISKQVAADYGSLLDEGDWKIFDADSEKGSWAAIASVPAERSIQMGLPEKENIRAAFAFCSYLGISEPEFQNGLQTFRKPAHRIEWVAKISGVSYYNDSKSSNIDSVMHAMALFTNPVILIVGGVDKGASYFPWVKAFQGKVKKIVAYGQASLKIEKELDGYFSLTRVSTLEQAVEKARVEARENDVVLLSPGCSSFDQFRNYEHRGEEFKRLVFAIK